MGVSMMEDLQREYLVTRKREAARLQSLCLARVLRYVALLLAAKQTPYDCGRKDLKEASAQATIVSRASDFTSK